MLPHSRRGIVFACTIFIVGVGLFAGSFRLTHASSSVANSNNGKRTSESLLAGSVNSKTITQDGEQEKSEASPSATETVTHTGRVTNLENGEPIVNAIVVVTRMNSRTWEEIDSTESRTNENGEYSFEIPPDQQDLRSLYLLFDLKHESFAPRHCGSYSYSMIKKNLKLGDDPWFTDLKMVEGTEIKGQVINELGKPVANAIVQAVSSAPLPAEGFGNSSRSKTITDENGYFSAMVTANGEASISVMPHDYCMKLVNLGSKRGDLGDIELSEGTSIEGKVLDAVGKPMEGLWVNISSENVYSHYEMQRSAKTDKNGSFKTRPLKPGSYTIEVKTKAEGALEKQPYANFNDEGPPAVFIRQTIEVPEDGQSQPIVIQAVPHIFIAGQCYNSKGEKTRCHYPMIMGRLDGQPFLAIAKAKGDVGQFEMMIPHGLENCRLNFSTSEHIALEVQLSPEHKSTTEGSFEYDKIEADMMDIKVTRFEAPILQVKLVDKDGNQIKNGQVGLIYEGEPAPSPLLVGIKTHTRFEKQTNNIFRSTSLNPNFKFKVFAESKGYVSDSIELTMKEGEVKQIELTMTPSKNDTEESAPMESGLGADGR